MHCTIDDLATLHTFEVQLHDDVRYLDTLDETGISVSLCGTQSMVNAHKKACIQLVEVSISVNDDQ